MKDTALNRQEENLAESFALSVSPHNHHITTSMTKYTCLLRFLVQAALVALSPFTFLGQAAAVTATATSSSADGAVNDDRTLRVHLVPHTHDDVGWLKTPKQYFYGFNNTIQHAAVKYILDTAIAALSQDSKRTFTYVEMAFFSMWWKEQSGATKALVKKFVANGQLTFVNGGWCMHDEAATHFVGMIDQTTLGHSFLKKELGVIPRVGWQLDPFGHSSTQASLLSSKVGFDALYFGRIDYQDMNRRHDEQQCEGFWSSSTNLDDVNIFWGLTGSYDGNYGPPPGFCFDISCGEEYLIGQENVTIKARMVDLVKFIKIQSDRTKGSNIMFTMGEDFNYENAFTYYENMDLMISKLMEYQAKGDIDVASILAPRFDKISIFYSSPNMYTDFKHKEAASAQQRDGPWEKKTDDFFPYSDCPDCFWTGYFTSRPALKRLERVGSSFLLASRQILTRGGIRSEGSLSALEEAMGTAQHHDAVSGTSKQHVAYDYAKQIQFGLDEAEKSVLKILKDQFVVSPDDLANLAFCQLRNETICSVTQSATQVPGNNIYLFVYNALAQSRSHYITVPVASDGRYLVEELVEVSNGGKWKDVSSVVVPNENYAGKTSGATYILHFLATDIPATGASIFRVQMLPKPNLTITERSVESPLLRRKLSSTGNFEITSSSEGRRSKISEDFTVSSGLIEATFSNGALSQVCRTSKRFCQSVHQEWGYYTSFVSDVHAKSRDDKQNSGAYIFRPKEPNQQLVVLEPDPTKSKVFKSDLMTEVHSVSNGGWIKQITRIYDGFDHIEIEYTVGPIPIEDGLGKEVVTRYVSSSIQNNGVFYTDSNGREFVKRRRSFRPSWNMTEFQPVSGNYYPINAAMYIEDDEMSLSIAVDRSQGGGSLSDGTVELMVHRRTLADDARGVGEAINETDSGMTHYPPYGDAKRIGKGLVISGKHRLALTSGRNGASAARSLMDGAFSEPLVFAASSHKNVDFQSASFSAIGRSFSLPQNVMLVTFAHISSSSNSRTLLLRLGHQYGRGEDDELSKAVDIDLRNILEGYEIVSIQEKTLSGNQDLTERRNTKLRWDVADAVDVNKEAVIFNDEEGKFTLEPTDIRTFEVKIRH